MAANAYLDACGFVAVSSGTGNFVVSSAVTGYQTPAAAGAVNALVYSYRAESADKSQWEEGFGAYTVAGTTQARTTITANSSGGTTAISFSAAPNVFITALSADLQNASLLTTGTLTAARLGGMSNLTNSLGADVALSNTANYFDGPSVAQGTSGTWWASGTVTLTDTSSAAKFDCKLWDGTTVIASASGASVNNTSNQSISLQGYLASPAGNIRISCKDLTSTSGKIVFNGTGTSKDSTISVIRIG